MFTIVNGLPEDILGVLISGKTTVYDYDQLNPLLEKHKMMHGTIKFYIEIEDLDYSAGALWEDLKTGLHYWKDFKFVALVTNKKWLDKTIETLAVIIPGLKVKGFGLEDRQKALEWLENQKK